MKKRIFTILVLLACVLGMKAQVNVEATIDSLQILIGEQAHVSLEVSLDADKHAVLPSVADTLVRGVEVLDIAKPDTQYVNDNKRMIIKEIYTITSFDSALYYLPPMEVMVDSQTYRSRPLALKVYSMPVDTLHPEAFFGPKDVMKPDFMWSDWYLAIACVVLWAPLAVLLVYVIRRLRDNKPIIRKVKVEPKLLPQEVAMKEIDRIKKEKIWQNGREKEYYTQLTETLRRYIQARFGFNAMEMTTDQIVVHLQSVDDDSAMTELQGLLQMADLVKFAKFTPLMNENDMNLLNAVRFINRTMLQPAPNAKPEPTEITIVEKRPLRTKILLGVAATAVVAVLVWSIVYVCSELYNYFA